MFLWRLSFFDFWFREIKKCIYFPFIDTPRKKGVFTTWLLGIRVYWISMEEGISYARFPLHKCWLSDESRAKPKSWWSVDVTIATIIVTMDCLNVRPAVCLVTAQWAVCNDFFHPQYPPPHPLGLYFLQIFCHDFSPNVILMLKLVFHLVNEPKRIGCMTSASAEEDQDEVAIGLWWQEG